MVSTTNKSHSFSLRDINSAVEEYYSKGLGGASDSFGGSTNTAKVQQAFDRYKDASGNIEIDGLQRFFEDLGINAGTDIITMLIS